MSPLLPHLSLWTQSGTMVFISGQLPFDKDRVIVGTEVGAQTRQVLDNLEAVLRDAGLERSDLVKTTVWLRNASDFAAFNESYAAHFGSHRPARSTVVCELAVPEALVEIEAIAARPVHSRLE